MVRRRFSLWVLGLALLGLTGGCDLIESQLTDISGWNLSACWDGFTTCSALFWDNRSHIQGGEQTVAELPVMVGR